MRKFKPGDLVRFRRGPDDSKEDTHLTVWFPTDPDTRPVPYGSLATVVQVERDDTPGYGYDLVDVMVWSEQRIARGFDPWAFELVEDGDA